MAYHHYHKVNTRIVRIFNTYGSRMRLNDGRAIPAFLTQALTDKSLTVFGKGTQTRSFCYIDDTISGIYKLLMSNINDPINIGNPDEFSILKLAKKIMRLTDSRSKIVFKPLPVNDPKVRRPNIDKAKRKLKWTPKVDLEEGLKKTIKWFKNKI